MWTSIGSQMHGQMCVVGMAPRNSRLRCERLPSVGTWPPEHVKSGVVFSPPVYACPWSYASWRASDSSKKAQYKRAIDAPRVSYAERGSAQWFPAPPVTWPAEPFPVACASSYPPFTLPRMSPLTLMAAQPYSHPDITPTPL